MQADRRTDMAREIDTFRWCFAKDYEKNKNAVWPVCITKKKCHVGCIF